MTLVVLKQPVSFSRITNMDTLGPLQIANASSHDDFIAGLDMLKAPGSPMEPFMSMILQVSAHTPPSIVDFSTFSYSLPVRVVIPVACVPVISIEIGHVPTSEGDL